MSCGADLDGFGPGHGCDREQRGRRDDEVQTRMGHSNIAITMDTYTKLFPDSDDPAKLAEAEKLLLAERDIDATCGEIHKQWWTRAFSFRSPRTGS
jgi:hypothetical protein